MELINLLYLRAPSITKFSPVLGMSGQQVPRLANSKLKVPDHEGRKNYRSSQ